MSGEIGKLALALSKAQGVMEGASKDRMNPAFKSKYADLASVWDACRAPLAANELSVVQLVTAGDDKHVSVETRLMHSSGESIASVCVVPVTQPTAQGVGSAITYARRYGLSAMVGVAPEDDDGNAAVGASPRPVVAAVVASRSAPVTTSARKMTMIDEPAPAAGDDIASAIAAAPDRAALEGLVGRIRARPESERATLRPAYEARLKAVSK